MSVTSNSAWHIPAHPLVRDVTKYDTMRSCRMAFQSFDSSISSEHCIIELLQTPTKSHTILMLLSASHNETNQGLQGRIQHTYINSYAIPSYLQSTSTTTLQIDNDMTQLVW